MLAKELLVEFYDPEDDKLGMSEYQDTRRPRLTLRHLQKMRIAKDAESIDRATRMAFLPTMYNPPSTDDSSF